jgi:hypothetical protein
MLMHLTVVVSSIQPLRSHSPALLTAITLVFMLLQGDRMEIVDRTSNAMGLYREGGGRSVAQLHMLYATILSKSIHHPQNPNWTGISQDSRHNT